MNEKSNNTPKKPLQKEGYVVPDVQLPSPPDSTKRGYVPPPTSVPAPPKPDSKPKKENK